MDICGVQAFLDSERTKVKQRVHTFGGRFVVPLTPGRWPKQKLEATQDMEGKETHPHPKKRSGPQGFD